MQRSPARVWWLILGWTLIAIAFLGLFDPVVEAFHGMFIHLEGGENLVHWILGAATLAVAYTLKNDQLLATLSIWYGIVYVALGIFGFFVNDLPLWHVGVADNILHLTLGVITIGAGVATRSPRESRQTV